MAKNSSVFLCSNCGAKYSKWQGKCNDCGEWNTIQETLVQPYSFSPNNRYKGFSGEISEGIVNLNTVSLVQIPRLHSGFREFDRVLGGGIVAGSVVLIGGNPGAGKSTLLLQMVSFLSNKVKVLYVTGEESLQQVALRAQRLGLTTDYIRIVTETSVDKIIFLSEQEQAQILIIDSIQVMHVEGISSAPGSVSQVRESAAAFTQFAKRNNVATFLVGHVTKDGVLAGPKILEHCVDSSILLEGDSDSKFRTLRCQKNRFGAVNEIGVFAMIDKGMREVVNPSAIFLNRTETESPGSVVMVIWEGSRPLLVELQALVDNTQYGVPRRLSIGTEPNRLAMLLAVLHRHGGISMGDQDVFVNVVGGVKVEETSADLPLLVSLLSSYKNKPIPKNMIVFGEVGLSGEIRPVTNGTERIVEAFKHGFTQAIVPKDNTPRTKIEGMSIYPVKTIQDILNII
ncbi:MAG: DNA repair protein RadA [Succinivibrionaceae bacterium]